MMACTELVAALHERIQRLLIANIPLRIFQIYVLAYFTLTTD